jgi:hypothetical protein
MSQQQARAWWADVQHLREPVERRKAAEPAPLVDLAARRDVRLDERREAREARRRTVEITGRTVPAPAVPRLREVQARRPARMQAERAIYRPDRVALWAVFMGVFLIVVALASSSPH